MSWSVRLGRPLGIPVYLHFSFLLLLGFIALSQAFGGGGLAGAVAGVVFVSAIFACVVLHEFGHALMARRYGIRTRDVILLPIGGVARLERMPADPRQELWVALAGPAVNVAIAGLLAIGLFLTGGAIGGAFFSRLLAINLGLVVFNMLPAFPMDGGRVLRALLARRTSYTRATETAATIGKGMALLFGVAGLFWNPMLLFIAMFVWVGAGREVELARQRDALDARPAGAPAEPRVRGRAYRAGPWVVFRED